MVWKNILTASLRNWLGNSKKLQLYRDSFLSLCLLGETAEFSYAAESFSKKLCNGEWLSKEDDSILHNFLDFLKGKTTFGMQCPPEKITFLMVCKGHF